MSLDIIKNARGKNEWNRVISYMCALTMSAGFIKMASTSVLQWLDYIGYGAGMAIAYCPVLAVKIIAAWRGQPCDAPPIVPAVLEKKGD